MLTAAFNAQATTDAAQADIVLFDPNVRWKVEGAALASQGKHTPFLGYELTGRVKTTVVGGRIAYQR